jgi:hypothetical protein
VLLVLLVVPTTLIYAAPTITTFQNRAIGGVASASAENISQEADKAFDNNPSTKWLEETSSTAWIQYELATPYAVRQYVIAAGNDAPERDPKDWTFEGSDDGISWVVLSTETNQSFTTRLLGRVFLVNNTTAYSYYRLNISSNVSGGSIQITDIFLYTLDFLSVTTNVAYGGGATSARQEYSFGSEIPSSAFDKNTSTKWLGDTVTGTFWLQYDFGSIAWKLASYTICTGNDAPERDPKTWTIQASNTGSFTGEQTVLDTVIDGQLPDAREECKNFTCSTQSIPYRYIRMVITSTKDSTPTLCQMSELYLNADSSLTAPTNFTVDNNGVLTWISGYNSDETIIVRGTGAYPTSITNGVVIYSGSLLTVTDQNPNPDSVTYYYSAWGVNGIYYSSTYAITSSGGEAVAVIGNAVWFIGLAVLAVGLTIAGYISSKPIIAVMGGLFWLIAGFYSFSLSIKNWASWDIYLALAFGCLLFTIVGMFAPLVLKEKKEDLEQTMMPESEFVRFNREMAEMNNNLHSMGGGYQPPERQDSSPAALQKYIDKERNKTLKEYRGGI